MKVFNLVEKDDVVTVDVRGDIGGSWWNEGVTYEKVAAQLKGVVKSDKKVVVTINSLGGDVDEAFAIYELLLSMGDRVTTECRGRCASAATIIAMGGHTRRMSRYALFLIHKCWSGVVGNENVLEEVLSEQQAINDRMAQIYADRSGSKKEDIENLMNEYNGDGTWLNVEQAMQYGFITEEISQEKQPAEASYLQERIKGFFNNKKVEDMKKTITSLACLVALLSVSELDSDKEGRFLLSEDDLKKINDKLDTTSKALADEMEAKAAAEKAKTEAEEAKAAAEKAKTEAEEAKTSAEAEKAKLEIKVTTLQELMGKTPAVEPPAGGSDTQDKPKDEFKDWYSKQDYVKEAHETLGR